MQMTSTMVVLWTNQFAEAEAMSAMMLMAVLAGAGWLGRALWLMRRGMFATLGQLLDAASGKSIPRCGTEQKYEWEKKVLGEVCEACRIAQYEREFEQEGY